MCSIISFHAYPPVVLAHLQLNLSSTTWCSSMYRSLRLSDSLSILQHLLSEISLSPVRWCWEQPSLILSLRPALPVLLSPSLPIPHMHASVFLSGFIPLFLTLPPCKVSPLFFRLPPTFSDNLWSRYVHPSFECYFALHFHCLLITDSINSKWPNAAVGCWLESKLLFIYLFYKEKGHYLIWTTISDLSVLLSASLWQLVSTS